MWRFYLDENVTELLILALLALGHDVVSTRQVGNKGASDVQQLMFAVRTGRILVTYNRRHFEMLQEAWLSFAAEWHVRQRALHPGVIVVPDPGLLSPAVAAREIDIIARSESSLENCLLAWERSGGWMSTSA